MSWPIPRGLRFLCRAMVVLATSSCIGPQTADPIAVADHREAFGRATAQVSTGVQVANEQARAAVEERCWTAWATRAEALAATQAILWASAPSPQRRATGTVPAPPALDALRAHLQTAPAVCATLAPLAPLQPAAHAVLDAFDTIVARWHGPPDAAWFVAWEQGVTAWNAWAATIEAVNAGRVMGE